MPYKLNLGFENHDLYSDFNRTPMGDGKYRMDDEIDSVFLQKLQSKLFKLLATVPESDHDHLVITGAVPRRIAWTAIGVFAPHFTRWTDSDGKTQVDIPPPPEDHDCDPE